MVGEAVIGFLMVALGTWYARRLIPPELGGGITWKDTERWYTVTEYFGRLLTRLGVVAITLSAAWVIIPHRYRVPYITAAGFVLYSGFVLIGMLTLVRWISLSQ